MLSCHWQQPGWLQQCGHGEQPRTAECQHALSSGRIIYTPSRAQLTVCHVPCAQQLCKQRDWPLNMGVKIWLCLQQGLHEAWFQTNYLKVYHRSDCSFGTLVLHLGTDFYLLLLYFSTSPHLSTCGGPVSAPLTASGAAKAPCTHPSNIPPTIQRHRTPVVFIIITIIRYVRFKPLRDPCLAAAPASPHPSHSLALAVCPSLPRGRRSAPGADPRRGCAPGFFLSLGGEKGLFCSGHLCQLKGAGAAALK